MDALRNLPTPLKIAAPIALAILLMAGVLFGTHGDGTVVIRTTTDRNQADAWLWRLDQDKIAATTKTDNGREMEIRVPEAMADVAKASISSSNHASGITAAASRMCTTPDSFSSQSQQQIYDNCIAEAAIQHQVIQPGVLAAKVHVLTRGSKSLTGSDKISSVSIVVFPDPTASSSLHGSTMAQMAARIVPGGSITRVAIVTYTGQSLWDGTAAKRAAGTR